MTGSARRIIVCLALCSGFASTVVAGQSAKLRVVSDDSTPIAYAWVVAAGHEAGITDAQGELNFHAGAHKKISLAVRRIGYQPWSGTVTTPDKGGVLTVTLSRSVPHAPPADSAALRNLELSGFYDRWLRKMQGMSPNATFIGPEMIEQRNPKATTDMLNHVFGITLVRSAKGVRGATGSARRPIDAYLDAVQVAEPHHFGHECYLTVVVDNGHVCPPLGCHHVFADNPPNATRDDHLVDLDKLVDPRRLLGIEVYPTKESMPDEVQYESEGCGVIVVWTGDRSR
ncbi:MAG: hypothetical protein ACREN6_00540 [Gemmatimonadaceae bacterium]